MNDEHCWNNTGKPDVMDWSLMVENHWPINACGVEGGIA